jgi:hypothetical protein
MARSDYLFVEGDLRSSLEQHSKKATAFILGAQASGVAGEAGEELLRRVELEYTVKPLRLLEEKKALEHKETQVDVSHDPMRRRFHPGPVYIPGLRLRYIVPFEGDPGLWKLRPSSFNLNPPRARIERSEVVYQYEVPSNEVERTAQYFQSELTSTNQWIARSMEDVAAYNERLPALLRDALERRRKELGQTAEQLKNLGIPIRSRAKPEPAPTPTTARTTAKWSRRNDSLSYDVALSFAGEDREYVEDVADHLRKAGVNVFYDKFATVQLWGRNLADHLSEIYGKRSRFVVMFISKYYPKKGWPMHERQSAQARAIRESKVILLPARFDDTDIPGLPSSTGYIDLRNTSAAELADLIKQKLEE